MAEIFLEGEHKEQLKQLEQFNYWLLFHEASGNEMTSIVHHIIGTEGVPTEEEINSFIEEVRTDEEFGLGDLVDNLTVEVIPKFRGLAIAKSLLEG